VPALLTRMSGCWVMGPCSSAVRVLCGLLRDRSGADRNALLRLSQLCGRFASHSSLRLQIITLAPGFQESPGIILAKLGCRLLTKVMRPFEAEILFAWFHSYSLYSGSTTVSVLCALQVVAGRGRPSPLPAVSMLWQMRGCHSKRHAVRFCFIL